MPEKIKGPKGFDITVLTEQEQDQAVKLAPYLIDAQLAKFFGIPRSTYQDAVKRCEGLHEKIEQARTDVARKIAKGLVEKALKGDKACMMFYLKTKCGWRESMTFDHTTEGDPVKIDNKWTIEVVRPGAEVVVKKKDAENSDT